jgi:hypothetical protein
MPVCYKIEYNKAQSGPPHYIKDASVRYIEREKIESILLEKTEKGCIIKKVKE